MKKNNNQNSTIRAIKKIRGDWGSINPVTKVIPDKRKSNEKREKEKEMRSYNERD